MADEMMISVDIKSNPTKYKSCPLRSDVGNCLPHGGFCAAVKPEICDALHHAYDHGKADGLFAAVKHYAEDGEE